MPCRQHIVNRLVLSKQAPVLDLKRRPDASRVLDGSTNQLSLTSQLEVNVLLVVLALDMRHVDGDEDVCLKLLKSQKCEDDGGKVGR